MSDENNISILMSRFRTGSIKELDNQKLHLRTDTKFIVPLDKLQDILSAFLDRYLILEVDGKREFDYYNRYYDTPDYYFYLCHYNGKKNRFKVRYRLYNDSLVAYMEVKHKSKGKTLKSRIQSEVSDSEITSKDEEFISGEVGDITGRLVPKLDITYTRITLFSPETHDKITIDRNIAFRSVEFDKSVVLDRVIFVEVKTRKNIDPAFPVTELKAMGFRNERVSKYCTGVALTCGDVKHGKFQKNIMTINKLSLKSGK